MSRSTTNLVLARFISRSGGEAAFFVGIWGKAAFEFEANAPQLAVLMGALAVASLIGSTLSGLAIDRLGPKRVLIVGEIAFVPVALSALLATDMRSLSVVAGFIGLVGAPVYTAIASFPPFLASDVNRLTKINAHVETAGMAALVAGTAIGAAIAEWGDLDWIFVFDAATSVVGAMLVLPMTLRRVESTSGEHGAFAESLRGFSIVYRHNRLRFYVLAGTAVWILFGMFGALEPLFYRDVLDATPSTIGWVNAILGVGLILGTTAASRLSEPWRTARFLTWLVSGIGVAAVIYVATDSLAVVTAGGFLWGLLIGVLAPLLRTLI
ncbi:MAG: MFS transporter, partial [Acidimicrobiia bacterium]|nr:MFS transporter [Acidimicrobiia bacterium]